LKILVVEDDAMTRDIIVHTLEEEGHKVITAEDGMRALDALEREEINLIISDIMMPNMSGLGLLSILKRFYFERIPVILISALDKGDLILSALGLGAADFLVKPLDLRQLIIKVRRFSLPS